MKLYQNLQGIVAPWSAESVTMKIEKQRVDVTMSHPPKILFAARKLKRPISFGPVFPG